MKFTIPIKVVSEANQREHWRTRGKRKKAQQTATLLTMRQAFRPMRGPWLVQMTRVCPSKGRGSGQMLDSDNLAGSFKHCRDAIASELGVDDGNTAQIRFEYGQKVGENYSVEVTILPLDSRREDGKMPA